jgi:hypothetical protein
MSIPASAQMREPRKSPAHITSVWFRAYRTNDDQRCVQSVEMRAAERVPRRSGSQLTLRWREQDSNPRSLGRDRGPAHPESGAFLSGPAEPEGVSNQQALTRQGRRARAVEFSTAIRIAIAENNKASGHGRALHVKRRTRVAQTPIYRYDGEHAAMMRQTQLALPREPVRRRGAQTVEWPRVIVDGKANNDQHALRRRASPLQRGRSSG